LATRATKKGAPAMAKNAIIMACISTNVKYSFPLRESIVPAMMVW
jgi:hypothetical protein